MRLLHMTITHLYRITFNKEIAVATESDDRVMTSYKHHTLACVRSNFFSERIVNAWNNLPKSVDFSTLSRFKRTIKRVRFSDLRF